jgi:hypothetical protein
MKPKPQVLKRFLIFNCLTRKLFLLMLSIDRFFRLSCPNRWDDVVGADDIQDSDKASSQLGVWYCC